MMFVFLFKQKAAYEMRISDWSSDVCSADLWPPVAGARRSQPKSMSGRNSGAALVSRQVNAMPPTTARPSRHGGAGRSEERRVGKSVSVRVDLGGRRILKKKRNTPQLQIRTPSNTSNNSPHKHTQPTH